VGELTQKIQIIYNLGLLLITLLRKKFEAGHKKISGTAGVNDEEELVIGEV